MTDRTKLEGVKAYKKFAVELNKEMRTRKTEVIGAFRALNRLGAGSTMYPPSFRAPSPMQIGGQVQGWALECNYNTQNGQILLMATCPFMSMKILGFEDYIIEAVGNSTAVDVTVTPNTKMNFGSANFMNLNFNRKSLKDSELASVFADIIQAIDMTFVERSFTSPKLEDSFDIQNHNVTVISAKY